MTPTEWITVQPEAKLLFEILSEIANREILTPSTIPLDTPLITACGNLIPGSVPVHLVPGKSSRSRANVARLWKDDEITSVGTGWALADDAWHEHTWGVDDAGIVETTKIQDHYYGVIFGGERAEEFLISHRLIW